MKKMYILAISLLTANQTIAQDINDSVTFELMSLSPESFYNGSDGASALTMNYGAISFLNDYYAPWDSWTGFSISNVTDNTTSGFGNQYASFAGGGSNSDNYAVFYSNGAIEFNQPMHLRSFDVTTTAYSAISMRDGDPYAKQFGSINNANGVPDGTNGEDFLVLHIIPKDANDDLVGDTIDFFLADFRFSDPNEDYILDMWTMIDLSPYLIVANKIEFSFSSSDVGAFGINTPTYFALDNFRADLLVDLEDNEIDFAVYPNPFNDFVTLKSEINGFLEIKNQLGQTVYEQFITENENIDLSQFSSGIYFATLKSYLGVSTSKIIKN